ncbi:carboxypeptidase-like regulatory domain-containing protein [Candidimonas nitroreducens]|uniref:Carboxypeptidase regulatory-like domain-containing protein n=1 Tax=Candidimonas nitroreducens TaxID=683354 RepID=A0A225MXX1_9BURK|nr:carboxypeptidase-like regulatory domain-containing protein [Candidimonas nitroreducens]OWT66237.1 hypothetical protein CEY11_00365 [Candidimonas nitroreducens]
MQTIHASTRHSSNGARRRIAPKLSWAAIVLAGALAGMQAYAALPPVQHQGSVEYVSGGIGSDESASFKEAAAKYPLALTFASNADGNGAYVADVQVVVRDSHDASVLNATSQGPYFLVRLPAGDYKVDATYKGKTQSRSVQVHDQGTTRAVFEWK